MKEPDIKVIRNKLGVPDEYKFSGYLILDTCKDDFLLSFSGDKDCFICKEWCAFPDLALKFDSYCKAAEMINHLEINTAIIVMAFDFGSQVGVIPFEPEMMN